MLGLLGGVLVLAIGGGWFFFHDASVGDPCLTGTIARNCESDAYCTSIDADQNVCMTQEIGNLACSKSQECAAQGKCSLVTSGTNAYCGTR